MTVIAVYLLSFLRRPRSYQPTLVYWPKINRKRGLSRLRVMRWFLSNDSNNSARGLTKFLPYLGKMYEPFNSLRLNPTENIMHNMHKSSIKRELSSIAVNSQINQPGVTLHFFRFLGDFEKGFAEPNAPLYYLLSWPCCCIKTKYKIVFPFLWDVIIKCSDNSGTPFK